MSMSSVVDKVQKLLALSKSSNAHEAAAAAAMLSTENISLTLST